jgi:DNA-binding response OmpR family regulator
MRYNPILVVDDEKNIRLTVSRSLEVLETPVQTAVNGEEALQKLEEESFSMVFLDLKLPGMDGMEVLHRIHQDWPSVPVVIITAHGTIDTAVEAMKAGAADFIKKPFSPEEIRNMATRVLERRSRDSENVVGYPAWIELIHHHIANRDFAKAREAACKAISVDPGQPEAFNLLGALYEIRGDLLDAQKFYRAALDIEPTYTPSLSNLKRTTSWEKFGRIDLGSKQYHIRLQDESDEQESDHEK